MVGLLSVFVCWGWCCGVILVVGLMDCSCLNFVSFIWVFLARVFWIMSGIFVGLDVWVLFVVVCYFSVWSGVRGV